MTQLVQKLQAWLPTLLSKKLGVAILAFIAEFKTHQHQTPKQIAIAVVAAAYVVAQSYLDAKTTTTDPNDVPGVANLPVDVVPAEPAPADQPQG